MKSRKTRALRIMFKVLAIGMSLAFFAAFAAPFTGSISSRWRASAFQFCSCSSASPRFSSYAGGRLRRSAQFRSLVAAERAVQAAVWHLSGVMLSNVLYTVLMRSGGMVDASEPWMLAAWVLCFWCRMR